MRNFIYYIILFSILILTAFGIYYTSTKSYNINKEITEEEYEYDDYEIEDNDDYDGYAYSDEQGIHEVTDTCKHFNK